MRSTVLIALLFCAASAQAQYKYVDQAGITTYSDRPPATGDAKRLNLNNQAVGATDGLPFALKTAAEKYPVTTYSSPDCAPCDDLRKHLAQRGVPFTDKLIRNPADAKVFKDLGFAQSDFPVLTVGSQKQVGYERGALDRLLDAAGYPRKSLLPNTYTQAPATPLTNEPVATERVARTEKVLVPRAPSLPASAPTEAPASKIRF
jgi:glutaredoxin